MSAAFDDWPQETWQDLSWQETWDYDTSEDWSGDWSVGALVDEWSWYDPS